MNKLILLVLLIVGCDTESNSLLNHENEFKEITWIYYGNQSQQYLTGCFWTQECVNCQLLDPDGTGIGHGYLGDNLIVCSNYGEREYIRYNINSEDFTIYSEGSITPQDYNIIDCPGCDTLIYN